MITGAISAMVGVAIKMSYNRFRKQRDMRAMMEAPTVILKKKYEIVHHDFLIEYGKIEKHECRIGIAQIGLSYTSGEDFANEYFTSDESHMMRLRPNMVEKVRANIKKMVGQAHENGVNILLFPEMTFDLNLNKMKKDVLKYAEDYNMYIITGGYHDVKTRQNVCVVFGPDGIQWSQEKHNPATIKLGENIIQEGIEIAPIPHKLHVASTEYGRIAIAICRDFLDMDLRVALKNCEPPVDLVFNPAWTPVTADFEAIHFDARRSIYAYQFFANVAEFGGTIIQVPEKDRTKRTIPAKEEGLIFKDVDIFSLRSERIKWEQKQAKERGFIQSTR
jgi:predicted amidohydrolase